MNREEVICSCNGITLGQIEAAVHAGDRTFEDVQHRLGIGRQCITCRDLATLYIESFAEEAEE